MRMDDSSSLSAVAEATPEDETSISSLTEVRKRPALRFTSNVVGSLFILTVRMPGRRPPPGATPSEAGRTEASFVLATPSTQDA